MHRYFFILLILVTAAFAAACGGTSSLNDRAASKKDTGACVAHADVDEVGHPSRVRLWAENTGTVEMASWSWQIQNQWYDASGTDGVYWLEITKPGTINALLRGVDANGNSCSSPIKIRSRNHANAAPVVLFNGPQDFGEHNEILDDGTALRYHEWRWDIFDSYDPETSIVALEWGVYGGADLDGDGIPDLLVAGKTADGEEFSDLPGLIVKDVDDPYQFMVWVTPELTDDTLRVAVTATDTAYKGKRWGDGHVTLMK